MKKLLIALLTIATIINICIPITFLFGYTGIFGFLGRLLNIYNLHNINSEWSVVFSFLSFGLLLLVFILYILNDNDILKKELHRTPFFDFLYSYKFFLQFFLEKK